MRKLIQKKTKRKNTSEEERQKKQIAFGRQRGSVVTKKQRGSGKFLAEVKIFVSVIVKGRLDP